MPLANAARFSPRRKLVQLVSYCTDVFRQVAVISRDDSRVESYSFDSLPTKRAALAIVLAEMQNVFVSLRPESRDTFFSKQVPHRISEGRVREWERAGEEERGSEEGEKRREEVREKGRAPIWNRYLHRFSNIFTFTIPAPRSSFPLVHYPSLRSYTPLIWNPQPNECTSTARLTSTALVFPVHANILGTL